MLELAFLLLADDVCLDRAAVEVRGWRFEVFSDLPQTCGGQKTENVTGQLATFELIDLLQRQSLQLGGTGERL